MAWLTNEQIQKLELASVGENVKISDKASFHNCGNIHIGDNTRIDDFCVISAGVGGIYIGRNVHIAVFSSLIGKGKITLRDFSNISSRVSIYSSNDDYSGDSLTNPTIPEAFKKVTVSSVDIGKHAIVAAGCVLLPGVKLGEGVAVGALSLVKDNVPSFQVVAGVPARLIGTRSTELLQLEQKYLESVNKNE